MHFIAQYYRGNNSSGIIALFRDNGADVNIADENGDTSEDLAIAHNDRDVVVALLFSAVQKSDINTIERMIERNKSLATAANQYGKTLLIMLLSVPFRYDSVLHLDMMRCLIEKGTDIGPVDHENGWTVLHKIVDKCTDCMM